MTIKEAERRTGLTRSNIRFYEKEKLIEPSRNDNNGYRDYSAADIENLKKIAFLRTLEITIEDIRRIIAGQAPMAEIIEKQAETIGEQIKLDSVSFMHLWGSFITWSAITFICLMIGILSYAKLPDKIPVQWSHGAAVSSVDKAFIFAYPLACVLLRVAVRPVIYTRLLRNRPCGESVTEYLTNYLCFIALSVELFSILFVCGAAKSVAAVIAVDTAVFLGMLLAAALHLGGTGRYKRKRLF